MNIQDWASVGEIVGAVGVIITLIYVAIQIRENSRQIQVSTIASINQLINEGFDPIYNSEFNSRIWFKGLSEPTALEEIEKQLFYLFVARLMNTFQTLLVQYRNETLNETDFHRYLKIFAGIFETPGGKDWFENVGIMFISDEGVKLLSAGNNGSIPQPLSREDTNESGRSESAA